ncbi:restriction endonuclease subunit S [Polyangium spumosum]|nr:restriction endonuclease subunit S [Polyangium spumosum]
MKTPDGWQCVPLTSVATLESGHTPSRNHPEYWDGGVPWIGIRDARKHNGKEIFDTEQTVSELGIENSSARLLPKGTVCLSRTASVGYVTIMGRSMATSQDFVNWVCSDALLPKFLMYLFVCEHESLRRFSKGAVHQTIYFPEVKAFHILLPPVEEQENIIAVVEHFLRRCDDLDARQAKQRETAARLNKAALDALTSAEGPEDVVASWRRVVANFALLTDVPGTVKMLRELVLELAVRGQLVPQAVGDEPASVLAGKMAGANPTALPPVKESEQPYSLPESWRWVRLGMCGGFMGGGTPSKSTPSFWAGPIPWVSPKDMKRPYIEDAEDHISQEAIEHSSVKLIPSGALLFVVRGMILAHSFPVALTTRSVTINQDMKALVLAAPAVAEYLLRACQASRKRMLLRVERSSHGTCRLDSEEVARFPIPLPPLAEQKRIVAKVDHLMSLCDTLEEKLRRAEEGARKLADALVAELLA